MLLNTYDDSKNVVGWLMSEKLDGIRGVWDGKQLLTKNGNAIYAPQYFIDALPNFALDGELWTTQHDFENIQSIILRHKPDLRWSKINYHIFDVPNQQGGLLERLDILKVFLDENPSSKNIVQIISQTVIKSKHHLKQRLAVVIANKGEGLVVRMPNLVYHTGRSGSDLKVKQSQDAECEVVGYNLGKGKFTGLVGSLICKLANNKNINIGSGLTLENRKTPPKIGSFITFKYYGFTKKGKPKFPVFLRVRLLE